MASYNTYKNCTVVTPKKREKPSPTTYAIDGLTEFMIRMPIASTAVEFHFTGGMLSGFGVRPATLVVCDPLQKQLLESSRHYIQGIIYKINK